MELPLFITQSLLPKFKKNNHELYLVGGAVRDMILNKTPEDFDLVTDATPQDMEKFLSDEFQILPQGKEYGVLFVLDKNNGYTYEIATFREDVNQSRKPEVKIGSTIEKDVKRRDITINGLFYDLEKGNIIDLVEGKKDIKNGIIRTINDPLERLKEDKLRVLRIIRFAAMMNYQIEQETAIALGKIQNLEGVSKERIQQEFEKGVYKAYNIEYFLSLCEKFNMFRWIFPNTIIVINKIKAPIIEHVLDVIIEEEPETTRELLLECKWKKEIALGVEFLKKLKLIHCDVNEKELTPLNLKALQKRTKLTNDMLLKICENIKMETYINWKPSVKGNQIKNEGYQHEDIGNEMQKRENKIFKEEMEYIKEKRKY